MTFGKSVPAIRKHGQASGESYQQIRSGKPGRFFVVGNAPWASCAFVRIQVGVSARLCAFRNIRILRLFFVRIEAVD